MYIYERSMFDFQIKGRQLFEFVAHDGHFPDDALFFERRDLVEELFPQLSTEEVEKQYRELYSFLYQKYAAHIKEKFNPDAKLIKKIARRALYALNRGRKGWEQCNSVNGSCSLLEQAVWAFNLVMGDEHIVLSYKGKIPGFKVVMPLPIAEELERYTREERRILKFVWSELQKSYNVWTRVGDKCSRVYVV